MSKCSFCGEKLGTSEGKMYVLKSNIVKYFCNSKCEKNWYMGRDPKKLKWTKTSREEK